MLAIGQVDEAIEELRRATSLGSARDRCRASYGLVRALDRKREGGPLSAPQVALEATAIANLADCAETVSELTLAAELFTRQGDLEHALKAADRAIARDPAYRSAFGARGDVHVHAGRLELAIADYERAVALTPDGVDPRAFASALEKARFDLSAQRGKKRTE
jgi:tetratricopeptide (TPR) repeat protein